MDFSFLSTYYSFFIQGSKLTIFIAFFTVIFGSILGMLLALMRLSNNNILTMISKSYIEFIRGTPALVQLYIVFYGLPHIGITLPDMSAGIIALSINSGAYIAEIIRAGIQAVDKGQMEAARCLGMTQGMSMRLIIIPQAIKKILPALGNDFIIIIKESSLVSIIGIHELMYNADTVRNTSFEPFKPLIVAAVIYFLMTFLLSRVIRFFERRLGASD